LTYYITIYLMLVILDKFWYSRVEKDATNDLNE